jgi:hypothetical protein
MAPWEKFATQQATILSTQYSVPSNQYEELSPRRLGGAQATSYPAAHSPSLSPSPPLPFSRTPSPTHLYDCFLHRYAATSRKRRGVFFTPPPIADYIVARVDRLLRDECDIEEGLASHPALRTPHSALPLILDPACGTGVFLLSVIDHVHRTLVSRWNDDGHGDGDNNCRWNAFVPDFLSRLVGVEILPAAAFLAKLNIALKLAETGYDFGHPVRLNIILADALSPAVHSALRTPRSAFPVLLGNPPFSSLSTTTNDWIVRLVRGDDEIQGYVKANGQSLGERKTWLHDDYVKFIRLAQWHVEEAGCGIVGFVTNHGYFDNATFRLMRHELLRVFPRIEIVDLHGNRKKHEVAPDGSRDENVFRLDQGVAISIFCRPYIPLPSGEGGRRPGEGVEILARSASEEPHHRASPRLDYSELWGTRADKLAMLHDASLALRASALAPHPPDWRFIPAPNVARNREYDSAWSLADAMPVNTTAPVTARDHFVVAFTAEQLQDRVREFRDFSIPDDEIRRRFFTRTRSARYPLGDTRGWKLSEARRIVAADDDWQRKIVRCLYRPFDWRYVFWHPAMIDWPRREVTRHLMDDEASGGRRQESVAENQQVQNPKSKIQNLCLLARRQQLPTQPCTFFWISDGLALDGVIRSDNRGSESLFPLYVAGPGARTQWVDAPSDGNGTRSVPTTYQANFAPKFIEQFQSTIGLAWLPIGRGDLAQSFGPEDLLGYIYALFHAPRYRERYADALRTDFPRIVLLRNVRLFASLCHLGHQLIGLHLLRQAPATQDSVLSTEYPVLSSIDESRSLRLSLSPSLPLSVSPSPPPAVASFRAGGYVALRKWLQPPHRSPANPEYQRIAAAIGRTLEIMDKIDKEIARPAL